MAIARYDLRLSEDDFWGLTPREYHALLERHEEAERRVDLRFGTIGELIAIAAGIKGRDSDKVLRSVDLFPSLRSAPKAATAPDGRPAAIVLEDSVAEGWLAWGRTVEMAAATLGGGQTRP